MGQPLTSREIVQQIREARDAATQALELARDTAARFVRIEHEYEVKRDSAFIAFKEEEGKRVSDPLARAKADLQTADERREYHKALEEKRLARLDAETWQSVLEALKATTYLINRELKLEEVGA